MPIREGAKGPVQKNPHEPPSLFGGVTPEPQVRWKLASWGINATPPSIETPVMKGTPKTIIHYLPLRKIGPRVRTGRILGNETAITIAPEHQFLTPDEER
jgi:hypothetical protein